MKKNRRDNKRVEKKREEKRYVKRNENHQVEDRTEEEEGPEDFILEGRNAVTEALNAEKTIHRLFIKSGEIEGSLRVIVARAKEIGIPIVPVSREKLDNMSETGRHQGVVALCPAYEYADLGDVLRNVYNNGRKPFLIILDKIYDPHNLGAIIRTACACGADAVIIPRRRSVGITAAAVRASAGAVEHVPVCRVANIAQTIDALKKQNIWIAGADAKGQSLYEAPLTGSIALVIGNESEGISRLVSEKCDFLVSIPMVGRVESLNASVAAAVMMYEVLRRKH